MYTTLLLMFMVTVVHAETEEHEFNIDKDSDEFMLEKKIHKEIFGDYNLDVRPEMRHREPLHVHFDNRLQQIKKLDVKHQIFIVNSFVLMRWYDPQLSWNLTTYKNITKINVGHDLIWTPDIVLYNSAHEESYSHHDLYKTKALVYHTGQVIWTTPVTWMVSCTFDVTWFPVDKQVCNLTFGSWSYSNTQITISPWSGDMDIEKFQDEHFHVKSGEWEINDLTSYITDVKFSCCPEPFSTIVYEIHLHRLSLYYFLYIILPLMSQVFLFLMIFHIPQDSGERMGFGVTILLSITVYLLVISEKLPEKSDEKPLLGVLFIGEFYILSCALVTTVITDNLGRKKTKPPNFLKRLAFGCKYSSCNKSRNEKPKPKQTYNVTSNGANQDEPENETEHNNDDEVMMTAFLEPRRTFANLHQRNMSQMEPLPGSHAYEWRIISEVMDKFFFYFYVFLVLIVPIVVVLNLDRKSLGT